MVREGRRRVKAARVPITHRGIRMCPPAPGVRVAGENPHSGSLNPGANLLAGRIRIDYREIDDVTDVDILRNRQLRVRVRGEVGVQLQLYLVGPDRSRLQP